MDVTHGDRLMIDIHSCPICNSKKLRQLYSTTSKYDESFRSHNVAILNHLLRNVLVRDEVIVNAKQCLQCKQIFVTPTFSSDEMARLYSEAGMIKMKQFYKRAEESSGLSYLEDFSGDEMRGKKYLEESIRFRSKYIYDVIRAFSRKPIVKLLDIGGGNGSNILSFGTSHKFVYDLIKPDRIHDQVEYVADLSIARSHAPYDLLVSTHTLEHIIFVQETVTSYTQLLNTGGLFYVEVPAEYARVFAKYLLYPFLKKGTHINWHVNYFSPGSLQHLFAASGYETLYLTTRLMPYENLRRLVIVGLFIYTGKPHNCFIPSFKWYWDFWATIIRDARIEGSHKLFNHYPSLTPFS